VAKSIADADFIRLDELAFSKAPGISIDYALMEKTERAALVPLDCGWSDTGAWETLWRLTPKDGDGNVEIGECHPMQSHNCYLRNEHGPVIATYGVDNLVIVATKDAVLVVNKDNAQSLKILVEHIRKNNPRLVSQNCQVFRPWGMYESINKGERYQVKRIQVNPGEKLSLQMHYHRAEHWIVVGGTAKVECDGRQQLLLENQSFFIPCGSTHRIENPGKIPLEIIEVQSGPYLGEDDIVRFEDRYGRISQAS
jgi:mannose-1-phosphate guanylyltransferase/mannose-6-phosphate isomerase